MTDHFLEYAEKRTGASDIYYNELERELNNLFACTIWLNERAEKVMVTGPSSDDRLVRFALALRVFLDARGHWSENLALLTQALTLARKLGDEDRVAAIGGSLAIIYEKMGEIDKAQGVRRDTITKTMMREEEQIIAKILDEARDAASGKRFVESRWLYEDALRRIQQLGDAERRAEVLLELVRISRIASRLADAKGLCLEVLEIYTRRANRTGEAIAREELRLIDAEVNKLKSALTVQQSKETGLLPVLR
jgi:hypothetical protein